MGPVMAYVDGDRSEENKEKVFESLALVVRNVTTKYAIHLRNNHDFCMDAVTDIFDKLHRPYVDFRGSKWRAYSYAYTIARNKVTAVVRRKDLITFESQCPDGKVSIVERSPDPAGSAEEMQTVDSFLEEFAVVAARAEVFGLGKPSLHRAMFDFGSVSGICCRVAALRKLGDIRGASAW